jgi:type II secretory pathway pseudopilin PulG
VEVLLVIAVLAVVAWLVLAPLRRDAASAALESEAAERAELEARKEAKYREIRDAEMDFRTGKLSEADWRATDRGLRAEAMEILRGLDSLTQDEENSQS